MFENNHASRNAIAADTGRKPIAFLTALCLALMSGVVHADVTDGELTGGSALAGSGVFQIIDAPATLDGNTYDDNNVRAFNEIQDFLLVENLIMDFGAEGLSSNVIGPDSVVSSHYIFFDPATAESATGTVTFDEPVLGIIRSNVRFNETDSLLGNPGTNYSIGNQALDTNDSVTIAGSTINFDLTSNSPGDAIRVITGVNPFPGINICAPGTETLTGEITGGNAQNNGGQFRQICAPIGDVGDDNFDSFDLFAFEEQQAVELEANLALDDVTVIEAGEFVSSYYVVWDPIPTNRIFATITFPDTVIGVISDRERLEGSEFLGNASANYLNPSLLGLESGDNYTIDGNTISIDFTAGSPGDSIRVLLGSASPGFNYNICEPQDMTIAGSVTGGTAAADGGTFLQLCDPIGQIGNDNLQANDLFAYEETLNVVLNQALEVDDPAMTVLPAGTTVSTYYVAYDPSNTKDIIGSVTFPGDILGIATTIDTLIASDGLGNPTAIYLNPGLRGLENDDFASFEGNTLSVDFNADSPGDYVRVFVGQLDSDQDGINDTNDNCVLVANVNQLDTNSDGIGNACDPDLNNDCVINFLDLSLLKSVFFSNDADADFTGDNVVNFLDLAVIKELFFNAPGPAADPNDCTDMP